MSKAEQIADLPEARARAKASAKAIRDLNKTLAKHRVARNHAMLALLHDPYNWPKTRIVRHVGVSRTMFVGVTQSEPAERPEVRGDAAKVAKREHDKVLAIEAEVKDLLQVRDDAIVSLLFDEALPNHLVAEITGENQVRIAQLRSGALAGV